MSLPYKKDEPTEEVIEIKNEKPGASIFLEQVEIERHNMLTSFEEIGFLDPFASNTKNKAEKLMG